MQKKKPMRMCIGCGEMKPKKSLTRIVKNKEMEIFVDLKGKANGRGAYICFSMECFLKAKKTKKIEKTFECKISDELYNKLEEEISNGQDI